MMRFVIRWVPALLLGLLVARIASDDASGWFFAGWVTGALYMAYHELLDIVWRT